jgi:recombination protein RecA
MLKLASIHGVQSISQGFSQFGSRADPRASTTAPGDGLPSLPLGCAAPLWRLFQPGQLLELSGRTPGKLSAVVRLIVHAQAEQEPIAWIAARDAACFYPPDFAQAGVDLAALSMVRLSEDAGSHGLVRAAEVLLRSGAFGLVVIDLMQGVPKGELSWQARLSGLLRKHAARAVVLTESPAKDPSLGPLVSLRVEPHWRAGAGQRVVLEQTLLKCKLGMNAAVSPDTRSVPVGAFRRSAAVSTSTPT